jgi:hypothetical protein
MAELTPVGMLRTGVREILESETGAEVDESDSVCFDDVNRLRARYIIQAPIIMMSQNRQEAKDRIRAEHDYRINLKAELEIRHLHSKVDQLLSHQWERLLEVQQMQTEVLEDIAKANRQGR